jgi:predicted nucleic acid-binding protein
MTGNKVALDTNQAVALLNNEPAAVAFFSSFREVSLPVPALGELIFGAMNSTRVADNLSNIDQLVARCRVLEVTATTAIRYAAVRLMLKRAGRPIPPNDVWIGALRLEGDIPLATADRHFSFITGLDLIVPP